MTTAKNDILKILETIAKYDIHDCLWWRCDGKYAPVTFWIRCNDLFFRATADLEELTVDNLPVFEKAFADVSRDDASLDILDACDLFCCRMRKMRPRSGYLKCTTNEKLKTLFDDCGPERDLESKENQYDSGQ